MNTIAELAQALAEGRTSSEALVEDALQRIAMHRATGGTAYISVDAEGALRSARASDTARAYGQVPSPLAGLVVSIKDLFDVAGHVTAAGSRLLRDGLSSPVFPFDFSPRRFWNERTVQGVSGGSRAATGVSVSRPIKCQGAAIRGTELRRNAITPPLAKHGRG